MNIRKKTNMRALISRLESIQDSDWNMASLIVGEKGGCFKAHAAVMIHNKPCFISNKEFAEYLGISVKNADSIVFGSFLPENKRNNFALFNRQDAINYLKSLLEK